MAAKDEVQHLFSKSDDGVRAVYDTLLKKLGKLGPFRADAKKTSIHLVNGTGFAGVHPRKSAILLNIRTAAPIASKRIRKVERVSAGRFHNELLLSAPSEVDAELIGWLGEAYNL